MTAITADGANANDFVNDAYRAPSADLIDQNGEAAVDRAFSREGRIGVFSNLARMLLGLVIMGISVAPMMGAMAMAEGPEGTPNVALMVITGLILAVGCIGAALYMIINAIKRLHDLNLSGWYYLVSFIPLVGWIFSIYMVLWPAKKESNRFAGATKPTSTLELVFGVLMLGLYITMMGANAFFLV